MKIIKSLLAVLCLAVLATSCEGNNGKDEPTAPLKISLSKSEISLKKGQTVDVTYTATNYTQDVSVVPFFGYTNYVKITNNFDGGSGQGTLRCSLEDVDIPFKKITGSLIFNCGSSACSEDFAIHIVTE